MYYVFLTRGKSEFCGEHVLVRWQKNQRAWNSDVFGWCFFNPLSIKPSTDMEPNGNCLCIRSWAGIKVCFLHFSTDWDMILHQAHLGDLFRKATAFIGMLLTPGLYYYCFICVKIQHILVQGSASLPLCNGAWTCLQEAFLEFLTKSFGARTLQVRKPLLTLCS